MKKLNINKILLIALSLVFLFQVFSTFVIIPIEPVISFLGRPQDPIGLFFYGIKTIIFVFIFSVIIETLYLFGFKISKHLINRERISTQAIVSFTTIWLTFFTYGLLSVFGVISKVVESSRLFSLYLFWFLLINAFYRFSKND